MKSPSTLTRNSGFTLIELIIVMGIMGLLATFGIIIGTDTYARYSFHSEAENAVSLLQKARSEAINNIGESSHGVYFADSPNLVLFQGSSYVPGNPEDLKIEKSKTASYSDTCTNNSVVFSQLSGDTTPCTVTVSSANAAAPTIITINSEGGIDW